VHLFLTDGHSANSEPVRAESPPPNDEEALHAPSPDPATPDPSEVSLASHDPRVLRKRAAAGDPVAHWSLAEGFEHSALDKSGLKRALFHYAVAVRLFEEARIQPRTPAQQAPVRRHHRGDAARRFARGSDRAVASRRPRRRAGPRDVPRDPAARLHTAAVPAEAGTHGRGGHRLSPVKRDFFLPRRS
jgi:hypothetical protein